MIREHEQASSAYVSEHTCLVSSGIRHRTVGPCIAWLIEVQGVQGEKKGKTTCMICTIGLVKNAASLKPNPGVRAEHTHDMAFQGSSSLTGKFTKRLKRGKEWILMLLLRQNATLSSIYLHDMA